jgi:predicted double-glycine peptidase
MKPRSLIVYFLSLAVVAVLVPSAGTCSPASDEIEHCVINLTKTESLPLYPGVLNAKPNRMCDVDVDHWSFSIKGVDVSQVDAYYRKALADREWNLVSDKKFDDSVKQLQADSKRAGWASRALSFSKGAQWIVITIMSEKPNLVEVIVALHHHHYPRHYPLIRQQSAVDCGPTCIAMICQFHNRRANLDSIREMAGTTSHGTSLLALAETAERLGFLARGVRANYGGLMQLKMPILCHWQGNHFIVLYEINPTHATIGDPAQEVEQLTRAQFEELYSGTALELTPATN